MIQLLYEILNEIDSNNNESEIAVMMAICESYTKLANIISNTDHIVQESSDNTHNSIKDFISKIYNFCKSVINKITNYFKKILNKKKELTYVVNSLRILEYIKTMKRDKVTQEAFLNSKDNERNEALKRVNDKKKVAKSINKDIKRNEKKVAKDIKKTFNKNNLYYDLSVNDIKEIVNHVTSDMTDDEFDKLKKLINDTEIKMNDVSPKFKKKLKQIIDMSDYIDHTNKTLANVKTDFNIAKKGAQNPQKVEHDLGVLKNVAESFGKTLNDMSNTAIFDFDNIKNIAYGGHPIKSSLGAVANWIAGCLKNIPELLKNATEYERRLYDTHHIMTDYFENDIEQRKELGIKTNKMLSGTIMLLDNIKEETYGWQDDVFYNLQSYGQGNGMTLMLGGPFTTLFKAINYLLTKDPGVFMESANER